jgi:hypothetical protein
VKLDAFLRSSERRLSAATPEADALVDEGALVESALLDVRMDLVEGSVWLLFDCRGALQLEAGNTAVLVLRSVRDFQWEGRPDGLRTWHAVVGSAARSLHPRGLEITLAMEPAATLRVVGAAGEFYVGDVPGCDEAPPNLLTASDADVRAGLQSWDSTFVPVHASLMD